VADQREGGIQWTDETWNPIRGCTRVSEGCRHCYAETVAHRFNGPGQPYEGLTTNGRWNGTIREVESAMDAPVRWKRPRRIFVNSMSDVFHPAVKTPTIRRIFDVMERASHHTFQVLTKRPERAVKLFDAGTLRELPNVHLGVSVENQAAADERIPLLLRIPAAVRFLSCEPLLGPVQITDAYDGNGGIYKPLVGLHWKRRDRPGLLAQHGPRIHWVIAGGESGPGSRPMHPEWVRSLRDQCVTSSVPFLFKQWGDWAPVSDMTEAQVNAVYRSNRKARDGADQDTYDELYGRTCTVDQLVLRSSGDHLAIDHPKAFWTDLPNGRTSCMQAFRVGKKAAGRLLAGRTWDEFPGGAA
jgi:protein gp37